MILHMLNKTRAKEALNHQLSENISRTDSVILIEDGVYQASACHHHPIGHWANIAQRVYALKDDAIARGIPLSAENVIFINYQDFAALTVTHDKVISWY